jgi:DeoR family transcriptional regulator, aga operon transcriptional repressor
VGVLISAARRAELLQSVQAHRVVQVNELARSLGVSASTIRRDLSQMEEEGLLRRVHGGAIVTSLESDEPQPQDRAVSAAAEKRRIAAAAITLVSNDTTILISGGTSTEAMLPLLSGRTNLTVVTNSLRVATIVGELDGIDVVVLGGYLRRGEHSLLGHLTRQALSELVIDRMFTGAFGLDARGVTGAHLAEAETDRHLMSAARELIVLSDSSKFGRRGAVRLAGVAQISTLITDSAAPSEALAPWREAGVTVVLA